MCMDYRGTPPNATLSRSTRQSALGSPIEYPELGRTRKDMGNRQAIADLVKLRIEVANLLGHKTDADYALDESMAKTPARVRELLDRVWAPGVQRARDELTKLQAMAAKEGANINIEAWDWRYYAEKVRAAEFDMDEAEIKPYLPLDRMIEAAFYTATQLFGVIASSSIAADS